MTGHYQLRSHRSHKVTYYYCLTSSILPTTPSSYTHLIQTSPAIITCAADYHPVSKCIPSIPISLLFQHHPTRHVSHPSTSYCDYTP